MSGQLGSADAIVEAALELAPEARAAFFDQACRGDSALRQLVEGLLQVHERGGDLRKPPVSPSPAKPVILAVALTAEP